MARITVEDCILKIPNRFDLVMVAAQRARDISTGAEITVKRDNDKNPVVSLREIAEETVDPETLRQLLIQNLQRHVEQDEPEDEDPDLLTMGEGLGLGAGVGDGSIMQQEIAEEVLTVGEEAVEEGAQITEDAESGEQEAVESADTDTDTAADDIIDAGPDEEQTGNTV